MASPIISSPVELHHGMLNKPQRICICGGEGGKGMAPQILKKKGSFFRSRSATGKMIESESPLGGEGARLVADFFLSEGTILWVSIGSGGKQSDGGGCSIVATQEQMYHLPMPLLVAGGGGGGGTQSGLPAHKTQTEGRDGTGGDMCSAGGKMGGSGIDCEGVGYGGVGFGSEKGLNSRALDIGSLKGTYGGGGRGIVGGGGGGGWSGGGVGIKNGGGGGSFVSKSGVNVKSLSSGEESGVGGTFEAMQASDSATNGMAIVTLLDGDHPRAFKINYLEEEASECSSVEVTESEDLLHVVAAKRWEPDQDAVTCPCCKENFGWTMLKHHCRLCGHVICGECSRQEVELSNGKLVRSCDFCARHLAYARKALAGGDMETAAEVSARLLSRQGGDPGETNNQGDDEDSDEVDSEMEDRFGDESGQDHFKGKPLDHKFTSWVNENKAKLEEDEEDENAENGGNDSAQKVDSELQNTVTRLRDQLRIKQLQTQGLRDQLQRYEAGAHHDSSLADKDSKIRSLESQVARLSLKVATDSDKDVIDSLRFRLGELTSILTALQAHSPAYFHEACKAANIQIKDSEVGEEKQDTLAKGVSLREHLLKSASLTSISDIFSTPDKTDIAASGTIPSTPDYSQTVEDEVEELALFREWGWNGLLNMLPSSDNESSSDTGDDV